MCIGVCSPWRMCGGQMRACRSKFQSFTMRSQGQTQTVRFGGKYCWAILLISATDLLWICIQDRIRTTALHICLRISDSHVLCNNTLFSQRLNAYMKVVPQDDTGSRKFLRPVILQLAHCSLKHVTLEVTTLWTDLAPCQPHSRYHDITQNRATDLCICYLYFSCYCWTCPIHLSNMYCRISCHVLMAIAVHSSCSEGAPSKCVKVHSIVSA